MVEFVDGSVVAQLSPPDMRLPIQLALTYPDRVAGPCPLLDLTRAMSLHFEPPDRETFPALDLGFEVMRRAGTAGAALNAANEAAVSPVPRGRNRFPRHPPSLPIGARPSSVRPPTHPRRALARRRLGSAGGRPLEENLTFHPGTSLKAALGLGFVIFIHELGHFLLAKWNGVKVEKFSIGFGPTLASYPPRGRPPGRHANSRPPGT